MEDPQKRERVELARNFAFQLLKAIKQIGMYRHNETRFPEFLQKAHEAVVEYTTKHGALSMKVEPQNLQLYNQTLFSEDNPLPYKFYKDGIRQLIFRPDLGIAELVAFTIIATSDPERGGEEVLAQLWKEAFEHIEYIVVEGFKMEECSEEEVEVEVDKIVGYLYNRLRTTSDDFLRFARVSAEDLDSKIENVDQLRGAVVTGQTATDDLKAKLQKEIEEEEGQRLFPKLVAAVFQVVESGVDDEGVLEEMFVQLLDAMLLQEDFATINSIVLKLRAMEARDQNNSVLGRLRMTFVSRMGEEQRLGRIGEILRTSRPKHPQDLVRYLNAVEGLATPVLLDVLEGVELQENRALLSEVLAEHAKEGPAPFVNRLESDRPQTVRDMVYILEKSGHPDRIKMFSQVLRHKNLAVKLDAMNVIARGQTGEARKLIADCLNDASSQVRMLAARLLPEFDREKGYLDLMKAIKDPSFEKKAPEEKTVFYGALGATGLPGALGWLQSILTAKPSLLNKAKVLNEKLIAINGLAAAESVPALKLLQGLLEDKAQPGEVLVAARKATYQIKKALFGDGPEAQ